MMITALIGLFLAAGGAAIVFDRARTEAAGLRLIVEMSGLLQASTSFDEAVEIVPVFGRHLFAALDGALYVVRGSRFELAASWGDTQRHATTHDPDCVAARRANSRLHLADEAAASCTVADGATICLPLVA